MLFCINNTMNKYKSRLNAPTNSFALTVFHKSQFVPHPALIPMRLAYWDDVCVLCQVPRS